MDHWHVVLRRADTGQRLSAYYSKGYGHQGKPPTDEEVLDCLASEAAGVENAQGFSDWCSEYGYDTDSRKALKVFQACEKQAEKLKAFIGADYRGLLFDIERL